MRLSQSQVFAFEGAINVLGGKAASISPETTRITHFSHFWYFLFVVWSLNVCKVVWFMYVFKIINFHFIVLY